VAMSARLQGQVLFSGKFSGSKDLRTGGGSFSMPALDQTITFEQVDSALYYAFPNLTAGKKWVALTEADLQSIGIDEAALQQQQSKQILQLLQEASSQVTLVGDEQLGGDQTTHYRATVRARDYAEQLKPTGQEAASLGLFGPTTPVDVWVGLDGRVRRVVFTLDLAKSTTLPKGFPTHGTLAYRIDILDYGNVTVPTAPPADQVMSYADLQAMAASIGTATK
jgi:hypothetical protein